MIYAYLQLISSWGGQVFCLFASTAPNLRHEVLMMVTVKITGFWHVMPCSLVEVYQHFIKSILRNVGRLLPRNMASHCRSLLNLHLFYILHVSDTWGNIQQHATPYNESHLHIKRLILLFKLLRNFQQLNTERYQLN